jgi:small neutral amino acid transporter SnatA (MarC family)
MAYYELARLAGILLFGLWQWRIVTRRMPPLRLWAGISLTLIALQCVQSWSQLNNVDSLAKLPFEANIVLPLGSPLPIPDLNQGVQRLWSAGWD